MYLYVKHSDPLQSLSSDAQNWPSLGQREPLHTDLVGGFLRPISLLANTLKKLLEK